MVAEEVKEDTMKPDSEDVMESCVESLERLTSAEAVRLHFDMLNEYYDLAERWFDANFVHNVLAPRKQAEARKVVAGRLKTDRERLRTLSKELEFMRGQIAQDATTMLEEASEEITGKLKEAFGYNTKPMMEPEPQAPDPEPAPEADEPQNEPTDSSEQE